MTELEIFKKCVSLGMTQAGAAGCTANILTGNGLRDFHDVDVAQVQSNAGVGESLEQRSRTCIRSMRKADALL